MANLSLFLLLFISFNDIIKMAESATLKNTDPSATNFIQVSCKATLYPVLCFQSLSSYASTIQQNERRLAKVALSVSLSKAQFARMFVYKMTKGTGLKPSEYQAVRDCITYMGDSIVQLNQSVHELDLMDQVNGQQFTWHTSNAQTWVSAALTDDKICVDGLSGNSVDGKLKDAIKGRITIVAKVTSNALALVNRFAAKHRAAGAVTNMP